MLKVGKHFAAKRSGVFFFDKIPLLDRNLQQLLKAALLIRQRRGYLC